MVDHHKSPEATREEEIASWLDVEVSLHEGQISEYTCRLNVNGAYLYGLLRPDNFGKKGAGDIKIPVQAMKRDEIGSQLSTLNGDQEVMNWMDFGIDPKAYRGEYPDEVRLGVHVNTSGEFQMNISRLICEGERSRTRKAADLAESAIDLANKITQISEGKITIQPVPLSSIQTT